MKNIIHRIVSETTEKFLKYFETDGIGSLDRMAEDLKKLSAGMAKEMLSAFIKAADEALCKAKTERKADGIRVHEKNVPRTLFTVLGELTYERTCFDTPYGRKYLADGLLGIAPYERVDKGVSAGLVNAAAKHSYGKSTEIVTDGKISRQTVRNKVMNTDETVYVPKTAEDAPGIIHIFADEAHVNLQNGRNTIVPLITVCEGKRPVCKGRSKLTEPFHIHGFGLKPETFREYVYATCAEKYDIEHVKKIYIYGDGAAWIKVSNDVFTNAVHILDAFHLKKRLRSLLSGEICAPFSLAVHGTVKRNNKESFGKTVGNMLTALEEKMPEGKERAKKIRAVKEHAAYILKHWDAIQNMKSPGAIGSCTEAMVSHVLSERFSRNPMGWSPARLSKMSMIRIFTMNGGKIMPQDISAGKHKGNGQGPVTDFKKYEELVKTHTDKILKGAKGRKWFETDDLISGKRTGTSVALDALAMTRNIG